MARSAASSSDVPLGSLTQRTDRSDARCAECGSGRVTHLAMTLTDGTAVQFISCHRCEHRTWSGERGSLAVDRVLDHTRKPR